MNENPECTDCQLGLKPEVRNRCLPSIGDTDCKLAIYLDSPSVVDDRKGESFVSENGEFIKYCLRRMSVKLEDVFLDYIVKCCPGKLPGKKADRMACVAACSQYRFFALEQLTHLKVLVVLGSLGCEVMTQHKTIGDKAGAEWIPVSLLMRKYIPHVWVGFSPGLLKEKPAESPAIFRVLWVAAEEAGLNPRVANIPPYEFPDR